MKITRNVNPLRLLEMGEEFRPIKEVNSLPHRLRGIYVLYKERLRKRPRKRMDVVYVGMAASGGIRGRLLEHKRMKKDWTHWSAFKVWDNISPSEVQELEGIFRHIYRKDSRAAKLNVQRSFGKMKKLEHILRP